MNSLCILQLSAVHSMVAEQAFSKIHGLCRTLSFMTLPNFMLMMRVFLAAFNAAKIVKLSSDGRLRENSRAAELQLAEFSGMLVMGAVFVFKWPLADSTFFLLL